MRPKDIEPLIFEITIKKKCTIAKYLEIDFWVSKINLLNGLTTHFPILEGRSFWSFLKTSNWMMARRTKSYGSSLKVKSCLAKSVYKMQFSGLASSRELYIALGDKADEVASSPTCDILRRRICNT
jgi:hypothetical protein